MIINTAYFVATTILSHTGITTLYTGIKELSNTISWYNTSSENDIQKISKVLKTNDIEMKLVILENLCKELSDKKIHSIKSIHSCIEALNNSVNNLEFILSATREKINKFSNKWFSSWRYIDLKNEISDVNDGCKIIIERFNLLVKLLTIHGFTKQLS